jgi:hypothetical protein
MTIAMALMDSVRTRQLDVFFSVEESISRQTQTSVLEIIKDTAKKPEDKIRLVLQYLLISTSTPEEVRQLENALIENGMDVKPVKYILNVKSFLKLSSATNQQPTSTQNDIFGTFQSIGNKLTDRLQQTGVVGTQLESFISSVKNLLPVRKDLPIVKLVDSALQSVGDDFITVDPIKKSRVGAERDVIVFVVGGGNYVEYQNLVEYIQVFSTNWDVYL